jgi:thioesterase domain-containing protein
MLFEAPTIALCAERLRAELPTGGEPAPQRLPARSFVVAMNRVGATRRAPFFLVAGMFGNVLNLRHLAAHLGAEQPVYAIQAKGLHGEDEPHTRFEQMAADYLREVRAVQPAGPYYLGGFSGGGLAAFEMAHVLVAEGERVACLVLLDTPAERPALDWRDRLAIQVQRLRAQGIGYVATWARARWRWELGRITAGYAEPPPPQTPAEFRSRQIERGFREALVHHELRPYAGHLTLFRPPLDSTYALPRGRAADASRNVVDPYNHWLPYVTGGIDVHVVPGDHDGMVLEPNVRVLAAKVKACLEAAQRTEAEARGR